MDLQINVTILSDIIRESENTGTGISSFCFGLRHQREREREREILAAQSINVELEIREKPAAAVKTVNLLYPRTKSNLLFLFSNFGFCF